MMEQSNVKYIGEAALKRRGKRGDRRVVEGDLFEIKTEPAR